MNPTSRPRVVVSGVGAVSAWGWSTADLARGLASGKTAIGELDRFSPGGYPTRVAGQVPRDPDGSGREAARLSFADRFALRAVDQARAEARVPPVEADRVVGVYFASSTGGMFESEGFYDELRVRPGGRPRLGRLASQEVSGPGDAVARAFGVRGPVLTVSSACASATLAIGLALDDLRDGAVDVAIAGGADSLCRITYGGFNALQSVDEEPCRPFLVERRGLSLGEGGAALILEREDDARGRGLACRVELAGAAASADAHHMTAPHPEGRGAADALSRALEDAGVDAAAVDFVNAHGTGTSLNDVAEAAAIATVFGERVRSIPVIANKASVGHLLGAAGAIEAVSTVLAIRDGALPPTCGRGDPDPAAPVDLVREGRRGRFDVGVSLNLAFGGCNGALVFRIAGRVP